MSEPTRPAPLQKAVASLKRPLLVIGLLAVASAAGCGWFAGLPLASTCTAAVIPGVLLAAQWWALSRAARPGANGPAWIAGAYPLRIMLVVVGLYVPEFFGVDVRLAAAVAIATIAVSMLAEVIVLSKARIPAVDAPPLKGE